MVVKEKELEIEVKYWERNSRFLLLKIRIVSIWSGEIVYASPSRMGKTLPASTSQIDPPIISYLSVGSDMQFVCWDPPKYASMPIVGYVMRLLRDGKFELEKSFENGIQCYVLTGLRPGLTYELQLQAKNGIPVAQTLRIPAAVETGAIKPDLVFANATNAFLLGNLDDFLVSNSPKLVFSAPNGSKITALDASATTVYIGLTSGEIMKLDLVDLRTQSLLKISEKIADVSYDDLNEKLYVLTGGQIHVISSVDGKLERKLTLSDEDFQNLAVDGWNGFIYLSKSTILVQYDAVTGESIWNRTSFQGSSQTPLAVDFSQFSLIFADSTDTSSPPSALARRFDTGQIDDVRSVQLRHAGVQQSYADIGQLATLNGRLFWVRKSCPQAASCLYSEERTSDGLIATNAYVLPPEYGQFVDLASVKPTLRPADMEKPSDVGLLASANTVKAIWRPPTPLSFQSKSAGFRRLSYVVKLKKGSREIASVPATGETSATFEKLNPLTVYILELQSCWAGVCSEKVTAQATTLAVGMS